MDTNILSPKALFQKDVRYTIPEFQRPYVWTQDNQWEPLWNDVRNVAEEYLEELERFRKRQRKGSATDKASLSWGRGSSTGSN